MSPMDRCAANEPRQRPAGRPARPWKIAGSTWSGDLPREAEPSLARDQGRSPDQLGQAIFRAKAAVTFESTTHLSLGDRMHGDLRERSDRLSRATSIVRATSPVRQGQGPGLRRGAAPVPRGHLGDSSARATSTRHARWTMARSQKSKQLEFRLKTWGGKRKGPAQARRTAAARAASAAVGAASRSSRARHHPHLRRRADHVDHTGRGSGRPGGRRSTSTAPRNSRTSLA